MCACTKLPSVIETARTICPRLRDWWRANLSKRFYRCRTLFVLRKSFSTVCVGHPTITPNLKRAPCGQQRIRNTYYRFRTKSNAHINTNTNSNYACGIFQFFKFYGRARFREHKSMTGCSKFCRRSTNIEPVGKTERTCRE